MMLKSINSKQKTLKLITNAAPLFHYFAGNVSKAFSADNIKKTGLHRYVYDFSVDYDNIVDADILDIHEYLIENTI